MSGNHSDAPSVVDRLFETVGSDQEEHKATAISARTQRQQHKARPIQLPRDRLAVTLQKCRQASGMSLAKLAQTSGIDVAHIWRIEQGEHSNVSREVLLLLSMGMVLDAGTLDQVVEIVNEILDAAGLKMLRAPWEHGTHRQNKHHHSRQDHEES